MQVIPKKTEGSVPLARAVELRAGRSHADDAELVGFSRKTWKSSFLKGYTIGLEENGRLYKILV